MRRLLPLVPLLLLTVGCGAPSPEEAAADAALERARTADRVLSQRPRTAEDVGWALSDVDDVEVMRLDGTSTLDGDGVRLVVRATGSTDARDRWGNIQEVAVRRCFALRASSRSTEDDDPREVDCPSGPPLTFAPPPEPPPLPFDELRTRLPQVPEGGRVDEAEVRRVLAALDLDPAIRTEVKADGNRIGVLLSVEADRFDPQECLLARVRPGDTEVWVPSRIQRMPGEGGCSVGNALDRQPPPH